MDADKPKLSINLAQYELDKARMEWAAGKACRIAENGALSRIQPGDNLIAFPTRP